MRNYILQKLPSHLNAKCEAKKPCMCVAIGVMCDIESPESQLSLYELLYL